jgi:hypothetical protein
MASTRSANMDCCAAFAANYEMSRLPAMREVEREVLGCDFGGTSWTTGAQATQIAGALDPAWRAPARHRRWLRLARSLPGEYQWL